MYICSEVAEGVSWEDMQQDPDRVIVGGRRITHNKEDADNPRCRGRYVAQEVNVTGDSDPILLCGDPALRSETHAHVSLGI